MSEDPFTPAELEAACKAVHNLADMTPDRYLPVDLEVATALRAVAPLIAARVREQVAEAIAHAIEVEADAYNARIAAAAGVPNRSRDGMVSSGIRRAAAIARAHRTTPGDDHA